MMAVYVLRDPTFTLAVVAADLADPDPTQPAHVGRHIGLEIFI